MFEPSHDAGGSLEGFPGSPWPRTGPEGFQTGTTVGGVSNAGLVLVQAHGIRWFSLRCPGSVAGQELANPIVLVAEYRSRACPARPRAPESVTVSSARCRVEAQPTRSRHRRAVEHLLLAVGRAPAGRTLRGHDPLRREIRAVRITLNLLSSFKTRRTCCPHPTAQYSNRTRHPCSRRPRGQL